MLHKLQGYVFVGLFIGLCLPTMQESVKKIETPTVTFNNGVKIPILGLGTWKSKPNEISLAIKDAIDIGYRHFDCAYIYKNENEIGEAIADKIKEGVVKREDLFITGKLWDTFHNPEDVEGALKTSLKDLRLEYLDLYLIHWPIGIKDGKQGIELLETDYVDTWLTMEELYHRGLVRSIGVSNFNKRQIERILEKGTVVPVTNQVECHPYLNQRKLLDFCGSKNITLTAHTPLGGSANASLEFNLPNLHENPQIKDVAGRYNKSPAQILIRYEVQRGVIVIPKSVKKTRLIENFRVFDFVLSANDLALIDGLDVHGRTQKFDSDGQGQHKYYPFSDEY